jgi:hypothetical protein
MLTRFVLLDLETVAAPDALQWCPPFEPDQKMAAELVAPIKADSRLTDPAKIAADLNKKQAAKDELPGRIEADIEARKMAAVEQASLDADLCRIVVVGCQPWNTEGWVAKALDVHDEKNLLLRVWDTINATTPMVGYGLSWFDAGVFVRRSQLLNVRVPEGFYRQTKYRHEWIVELADRVTLNGMIDQKKGRGLDYHCRRFGIEVADEWTGKDVAALWAEGAHDAVVAHCMADLLRIQRLAERLFVIPTIAEADVALPLTEQEVL